MAPRVAEALALEGLDRKVWLPLITAAGWRVTRPSNASLFLLGAVDVALAAARLAKLAKTRPDGPLSPKGQQAARCNVVLIFQPSTLAPGVGPDDIAVKVALLQAWVEAAALAFAPKFRVNAILSHTPVKAWQGVGYVTSSPTMTGRILGLGFYPRPYIEIRSGFGPNSEL